MTNNVVKITAKEEKVAINDVLPFRATRRDAVANKEKIWVPRDTSDLISIVSFIFAMRRHVMSLAP